MRSSAMPRPRSWRSTICRRSRLKSRSLSSDGFMMSKASRSRGYLWPARPMLMPRPADSGAAPRESRRAVACGPGTAFACPRGRRLLRRLLLEDPQTLVLASLDLADAIHQEDEEGHE